MNSLPGLLAGIQVAGLLFFLNPRLPFDFGTVGRAVVAFGGVLGLATAAVLTAFTWHRAGGARRLLPWSITAVLAGAALLDSLHASHFGYFIPTGMNVRLIKAALWLTLASLICFYTALLHSFQQRPYGIRTRIGLAVVAIASVVVLFERREAFKPDPRPAAAPAAIASEPLTSLYVVGLSGATLDAILPLARQGQLPFLAHLIEAGGYGRLASFSPPDDDALWTTLGTGKHPYKHGVLGGTVYEVDFLSRGALLRLLPYGLRTPLERILARNARPADSRSRDSLAGWEILSRLGLPAGAVGWPATRVPEEDLGFLFSDRYFEGDFTQASAHPSELGERGILFRVGTDELDADLLEPFGPEVPLELLRILSEDMWRESLSDFVLEQERSVRAFFIRLPGLLRVSELYFGGYSAAQFEGIQEDVYQDAARFITAYYQHLDGYLAQLWQRDPADKLLAVVSAHGVRAPEGWRKLWGKLVGRPVKGYFDNEPDGVFLLLGSGVQAGSSLEEANIIDVLPTLLYGLGLPIAQDLDGRVLTSAFEPAFLATHPVTYVPSYDTLEPAGP